MAIAIIEPLARRKTRHFDKCLFRDVLVGFLGGDAISLPPITLSILNFFLPFLRLKSEVLTDSSN